MLRRYAVLLPFAAASFPGPAHAEAARLRVTRGAAAMDCPAADELTQAVNARVGAQALAPGTTPWASSDERVDVAFEFDGEAYRAVIHAEGRWTGERIVVDASSKCSGLATAVELTVALLLDTVPAAKADLALPLPADGAPATPSPADERSSRLEAAASGGVAAGVLRSVTPSVLAELGLAPPGRWSGRVGTLVIPYQSTLLGPGRIDATLASAYLDLCVRPFMVRAPVALNICASPHGGVLHGSGHGFASNTSITKAWFGAGLAGTLSGHLVGRLGWQARLEGIVLLTRETFAVDRVGAGYDPSAVGALVAIGPTFLMR